VFVFYFNPEEFQNILQTTAQSATKKSVPAINSTGFFKNVFATSLESQITIVVVLSRI